MIELLIAVVLIATGLCYWYFATKISVMKKKVVIVKTKTEDHNDDLKAPIDFAEAMSYIYSSRKKKEKKND